MATPFPNLKFLTGPEEGQEVALTQKTVHIGRSEFSEVALSDTSVSRNHCLIEFKNGAYFLRDDRSRNGTFLEDEKLPETAEIKLNHLDLIRIGIYEIRFLEREFNEKDLVVKEQQKAKPTPTQLSAEKPIPATEVVAPIAAEDSLVTNRDELEAQREDENDVPETRTSRNLTIVFGVAVAVIVVIAISYFAVQQSRRHLKPDDMIDIADEEPPVTEKTLKAVDKKSVLPDQVLENEAKPTTTKTDGGEDVFTVLPGGPIAKTGDKSTPAFPVFLDVKSEPMPAVIYFQGKRLGPTPLKQSISVVSDTAYDVYADFELRDIGDIYRKKVNFRPRPDSDIVELNIKAEIGTLKIQKLPRRVEFYLEGFYSYDNVKSNPVRINDISYGRPIYLPYGKYLVELRERTKVAGSENEIKQTRFQREYVIDEAHATLELSVVDKDLQFFPVTIKSQPTNAIVYYGAEKLGNTPYQGQLPIGANKLRIAKDGFFDTMLNIDMPMNSLYETVVELKTSKMGELINAAKQFIRDANQTEALNTLVEALKFGGSTAEKAEVYYLMGDIYLKQGVYEQAQPYFEKARSEPVFAPKASLGLIQVKHGLKNDAEALPLLVEVMMNLDDKTPDDVKASANAIFKQISPLKSVLFIQTEPKDAAVYVNSKKLAQTTPVIVSELGLGNYNITIEKAGYQTFKTQKNLKIGEFAPIQIKLSPEQL